MTSFQFSIDTPFRNILWPELVDTARNPFRVVVPSKELPSAENRRTYTFCRNDAVRTASSGTSSIGVGESCGVSWSEPRIPKTVLLRRGILWKTYMEPSNSQPTRNIEDATLHLQLFQRRNCLWN